MRLSLGELQTRTDIGLARHKEGEPGPGYMITTGLECSYPTVEGGRRRDELEETGHYEHWEEDFDLCREIGARYVRYGIPYYKTHLGPDRYDWSFPDEVLPAMWDKGLIPIADLCHFGVPDWIGAFQNTDWPPLFAAYCAAFAERYPWIKFYTPINEMLVCARFSALYGGWNEQDRSDRAMVRAHSNMCRATLLAIPEILKRRPDAVFIQSEIAEAFVPLSPKAQVEADYRNELRFLSFDHLYGRPPNGNVTDFLEENGLTEDDLEWFLHHGRAVAQHCILGTDYYSLNEHIVMPDGKIETQGEMLGWHAIARDYYTRYRRPLMLTETNKMQTEENSAANWLKQTWGQAHHLRQEGVPVIGYTWYSLTDQIDWDIQIVKIRGKVNANGLCTLDRKLRPAGKAFKALAHENARAPLINGVPPGILRT